MLWIQNLKVSLRLILKTADPACLRRLGKHTQSPVGVPSMLVCVCTSMWIKKCLAAMLAVKRLTSVTSEVNLRNPLHSSEEAYTWGFYSGFEIQSRRHQKSKTGLRGISGPTKRTDVLQIYFVKESTPCRHYEVLEYTTSDDAGVADWRDRSCSSFSRFFKRTSRLNLLRCDSMFAQILQNITW